jgi:amidase
MPSAVSTSTQLYQEVAIKAQAEVNDAIPPAWKLSSTQLELSKHANVTVIPSKCGLLTPAQIEITEQTATELLAKLATGKLSSVEVTEAFCIRAAIAHQLVCRHLFTNLHMLTRSLRRIA